MIVLAIDPGPKVTGWVVYGHGSVARAGVTDNDEVLSRVLPEAASHWADVLAIEKIESMGMAVGADVFETVHWCGRFYQAWPGTQVLRITRRQVKLHLCGNMRAKDPNIRQALIDMLGAPGTKKAPGGTYGVTSHAWSALAVAVVAQHELGRRVCAAPSSAAPAVSATQQGPA